MTLDVRLEQIRSCIVLKDAIAKNFVANENHSFTSAFKPLRAAFRKYRPNVGTSSKFDFAHFWLIDNP